MNLRVEYKVEDFLKDESFICYILDVSSEAASEWENLLREYPELARKAAQAKAILTGEDTTYQLSCDEIVLWKQQLMDSIMSLD